MNVPLYVFGKAGKPAGGVPQSYAVLARHPAFAGEAAEAAERLSREFRWRPGGKERRQPCYAVWPLADGWLAVRFLDMGEDDFGRPHTLRMEAGLVQGVDWSAAAALTRPASWPTEPCEGDTADLMPVPAAEALERPVRPAFLAFRDDCQCDLFAMPAAPATAGATNASAGPAKIPSGAVYAKVGNTPAPAVGIPALPKPWPTRFEIVCVGILLLASLTVALVYSGMRNSALERRIGDLEREAEVLADERKAQDGRLAAKDREAAALREAIAQKEREIADYIRDAKASLAEDVIAMNRQNRELAADLDARVEELRAQMSRLEEIGAKAKAIKERSEAIEVGKPRQAGY